MAAVAGLLAVTPVLAQGRDGATARGARANDGAAPMHRAWQGDGSFEMPMRGRPGSVAAPRGGAMGAFGAQRLPLGTELTVELFEADPADGAEPIATLSMTVGEDSEAAFAEQLREAASDATFARTTRSETTRRIEIPDVDAPSRASRAPLGGRLALAGLEDGQTVTVAVFAAADDATPSTTLSFTYGVDSAAGFQADLEAAMEEAAVVEVTQPEQVRTIEIGAADDMGGQRPWGPHSGGRPSGRR